MVSLSWCINVPIAMFKIIEISHGHSAKTINIPVKPVESIQIKMMKFPKSFLLSLLMGDNESVSA